MLEFTLEKERDKGKFLQELPIDILNFDIGITGLFSFCIKLLQREVRSIKDKCTQQTFDLYEARCEIARLRSLLPSENVPPRDPSPIETVTVREGNISPKSSIARRDVNAGVYVREREGQGEIPARTSYRHTQL